MMTSINDLKQELEAIRNQKAEISQRIKENHGKRRGWNAIDRSKFLSKTPNDDRDCHSSFICSHIARDKPTSLGNRLTDIASEVTVEVSEVETSNVGNWSENQYYSRFLDRRKGRSMSIRSSSSRKDLSPDSKTVLPSAIFAAAESPLSAKDVNNSMMPVNLVEHNSTSYKHVAERQQNGQETKRARRLLEVLACSFQRNNDSKEDLVHKRAELDKRILVKERVKLFELRKKNKEDYKKKEEDDRQYKEYLVTKEKLLLMEMDFACEVQREEFLSHYLRASDPPHVFWMPTIIDRTLEEAFRTRKEDYHNWRVKRTKKYEDDRAAYIEFREQKHHAFLERQQVIETKQVAFLHK